MIPIQSFPVSRKAHELKNTAMPRCPQMTFLVLLFLSFVEIGHGQESKVNAMLNDVENMSKATSSMRRTYIETALEEMGSSYQRHPWQTRTVNGVNLEVRLGKKNTPPLVLAAHFDVRKKSRGANNNASGCAVLLDLIRHISHAEALKDLPILCLFLDGSESRFAGSLAFGERHVGENFCGVINFDLCGTGDTVIFGPTEGSVANAVARWAREVAQGAENPAEEFQRFMPGDHRSFAKYGLDCLTISVAPKKDILSLRKRFERRDRGTVLPTFLNNAIRGQDQLKSVTSVALEKAKRFGLALIQSSWQQTCPGNPSVSDLKTKQKEFIELLETGEFSDQRDACGEMGINGVLTFLTKKAFKNLEVKEQFKKLIPRLFSGKELREAMEEFVAAGKCAPNSALDQIKSHICWDKNRKFFHLMKP